MLFSGSGNFGAVQKIFFFILLLVATVLLLWVLKAFWAAIFWAVILAVVFEPIKRWWRQEIKTHPNVAAFMTVLTVVIFVLAPLFGVGTLVFNEARNFYGAVAGGDLSIGRADIAAVFDSVSGYLAGYGFDQRELAQRLAGFAATASGWLAQQAIAFGQGTFVFLLHLLLMLYVLFYALRDGPEIIKKISDALPLGRTREGLLFDRIGSIIRAIIKGTILIAVIQGLIGGVLFWLVGIPAPAVWGTLMTILAILPMVGPGVVWFPAGVLLIAAGSIGQGVAVLLGGALAVGLVDNLLRPILVGRDTQMPNVLVFLSGLGGITVLGVTGFIVGPVIAGIFLSLWQMFETDYKRELKARG